MNVHQPPALESGQRPATVLKSVCRSCHGGCGVLLHVKDGVLLKVEGDRDSPLNHGRLCPIGTVTTDLVYHPDRLKYPLRRKGKRQSGEWQRISWDDALDEISERLLAIRERHGPEAIALGTGTGRHHIRWVSRFGHALGTPNWCEPGFAQCFHPRVNTSILTFGDFPVCDYTGEVPPACILYWGHNPVLSGPDGETRFNVLEALEHNPKIIVVDPRRTALAEKADIWLQIRPGADDALALAMLNVIIEEQLYDEPFVTQWTHGFAELAAHVKKYTPEWAAPITWVGADKIRAAARLFAQTKPAMMEWGCAIEHTPKCIQTIRAVSMLPALTGNIDVPGGWVFGMHGLGRFPSLIENLTPEANAKRLGGKRFKLLGGEGADLPAAHIPTLLRAMRDGEPYPVKAFLVFGNNTLTTYANTSDVYDALMRLDFMVCADLFMTPTAELADIVLPAASWPELDEIVGLPTVAANVVLAQQKAVQIGECKSDEEIFVALARRMKLPVGTEPVKDVLDAHARRRRAQHHLRRAQAEGLHQAAVQVPEIPGRRVQDADRKDRALCHAVRAAWLCAVALLRGAAGKSAAHAQGRGALSIGADDRRANLILLQFGAPPARQVAQGAARSHCRNPSRDGGAFRDRQRGVDVDRNAARPDTAKGQADRRHRPARDPRPARLVVPRTAGPGIRRLDIERQCPDQQPAALRPGDGDLSVARAVV